VTAGCPKSARENDSLKSAIGAPYIRCANRAQIPKPNKEIDMAYAIGLPNGRKCSIPTYIASWRALKALPADAEVKGWEWYPVPAGDVLRELRAGIHDRINRKDPAYGKGRKWDPRYQIDLRRDADCVNSYSDKRIVYPVNRLSTPELQDRFGWHYTSDGLEVTVRNARWLRRAAA
jgi:hypothetical protein